MDKMGITPQDLDDMDDQLAEMDGMLNPEARIPFRLLCKNWFDNSNLPSEAANPEPGREGFPPPRGKREEKKDRRQQRKYLDNFCQNLNRRAQANQLDRIVGRESEIIG